MRLLTKILSFVMLLFLLTAEDCSDTSVMDRKEARLTNTYRDIENNFAEDDLSDNTLFAFEKRAIEKLKDISDYINIYADSSLSVEFKTQAKDMIRESFFELNDVKVYFNNLELREDSVNTTLYYSKYGQSFKSEIHSVRVTNHLSKNHGSDYIGEIQFTQIFRVINSIDKVTFYGSAKIMAVKTEKYFGNEVQEVWEVYLSETKLENQN